MSLISAIMTLFFFEWTIFMIVYLSAFLGSCRQAFFSIRLVSVHVVHPYSSINTTADWKKLRFILSVRSDFHMTDSLLIAVHAFVSCVSMSVSVDETLCEQYWTGPGGSTSQSSSCTATYHPSRKLSKLYVPDMRDTAGEVIRNVLLWTPSHGRTKAGRLARTYIQQFCADTGCSHEKLPEKMDDTEGWREKDIRAAANDDICLFICL